MKLTQSSKCSFNNLLHLAAAGEISGITTVLDGHGENAVITSKIVTYAADGFVGTIGGFGNVLGSNGFQDITVSGDSDNLTFDASFGRGDDVIRFPDMASAYQVSLFGSTVLLGNGTSSYTLPFSDKLFALVFSDGARALRFDTDAKKVLIGDQSITTSPATLITPQDGTPVPNNAVESAVSTVFLPDDTEVTLGGDYRVFGSSAAQGVHYRFGDVVLDPSFSSGGDVLHLQDPVESYSAYLAGSSLVLVSTVGTVTIPVGPNGIVLDFADSERQLFFDLDSRTVKLGEQEITANSAATAQQLGDFGGGGSGGGGGEQITLSIDVGDATSPREIALDPGKSYILTDSIAVRTNVVISGMNEDDSIIVTGIQPSQFNYTSEAAGTDGTANDLSISFSNGSNFSLISILDVVDPGSFVFNETTAEAAAGWNLISFA